MAIPRSLALLGIAIVIALGQPVLAHAPHRPHVHSHKQSHKKKSPRASRRARAAAAKVIEATEAAAAAPAPTPAAPSAPAAPVSPVPTAGSPVPPAPQPHAPLVRKPAEPPVRAPREQRWKAWGLPKRPHPVAAATSNDDDTDPQPPPAAAAPSAPGPELTQLAVLTPPPRLVVRLGAEVGYQHIASDFSGNGASELSHYRIAAPALALRVHGDLARRIGSGLRVGAQVDYLVSSWTGIHYAAASGQTAQIPYLTHELTGAATIAHDLGPLVAGAHAGYHYRVGLTPALDNLARLPREALSGLIAGLDLELPAALRPVSLRLSGDFLVPGPWTSMAQTAGLADGQQVAATSTWGTLSASLPLTRWLALEATLHVGWTRLEFSGVSQRVPDVTAATRTDVTIAGLAGATGRF